MPIKLIQVQRKLNVGINTVVEFLHKKGFEVEDNPNTRISDEQYALLVKEFGKNLPEKERLLANEPVRKEEPAVKKEERKKKAEEIETVIPEELRPRIVSKGHIELGGGAHRKSQEETETREDSGEEAKETPTPDEVERPSVEDVPAPAPAKNEEEKTTIVEEEKKDQKEDVEESAVEKTQEENPRPEPQEEVKKEEELFRLDSSRLETKIKVTGKIDLDSLNQSTRPKKKTKEE